MSGPPKYILEGLEKQSPETLREIAQIAIDMADRKERQLEADLEEQSADDRSEDLDRDDAPSSATLTVKEISGNQYYYWQWREGETIKSEPTGGSRAIAPQIPCQKKASSIQDVLELLRTQCVSKPP